LIAYGHPPQSVWNYTPVQASAFIALAERRRRMGRALNLQINAMASRGKVDDINKKIRKDWDEDGC